MRGELSRSKSKMEVRIGCGNDQCRVDIQLPKKQNGKKGWKRDGRLHLLKVKLKVRMGGKGVDSFITDSL